MQVENAWSISLECELYDASWDSTRGSILFTNRQKVSEARVSDAQSIHGSHRYFTPTRCVSISSDGTTVAVGEAGGLVSFRSHPGILLSSHTHSSAVRCLSFHPSRNICLSGSEEAIRIWLWDLRSSPRLVVPSPCLCLAWSLCGGSFLYGLANGDVSMVDVYQLDSHIWLVNLSSSVWCCAYLTDSEVMVGSWDPPALNSLNTSDGSLAGRLALPYPPTCITRYSEHMVFVGDSQGYITLYCKNSSSNFMPLHSIDTHTGNFITFVSLATSSPIIVAAFNGTLIKYRIRLPTVACSSESLYCIRDNTCLSRFSVYLKDLSSTSPTHPVSVVTTGLVAAMGSWNNRVAVLIGENLVKVFCVNNQRIENELEYQLNDESVQRVRLIAPLGNNFVIVHDDGLRVSSVSPNGTNITLHISSRVEFLKIISDDNILLMTSSGDLMHAHVSAGTVSRRVATPCHGIKSVDTSLRKSCLSILENSGDFFIFERTTETFSASNIISSEWNRAVDGLCILQHSCGALTVWDRFTRSSWTVGKFAGKLLITFDAEHVKFIQENGSIGHMQVQLENLIRGILASGSRESVNRAYIIAMRCTADKDVLNAVGEAAIRTCEMDNAKNCFHKSGNRAALFLTSLPHIRKCPDGYVDLAQGRIESGVQKLWNVSHETRDECIDILVRFRAWSTLLNLGGPDSFRKGLGKCDDRLTSGYGYMEMGDMKNACAAFISCRKNDLVLQCVTDENIEIGIEYFDTVDDWTRLKQLLMRTDDVERIARAHVKRSRWLELKELSAYRGEFKRWYSVLHGRHLVETGEDVSSGLWKLIQSRMAPVEEITAICREWTEKFALLGQFRRAACIAAIDPTGSKNETMIYYAYSLVQDELSGDSPFSAHDSDLILNACLYLLNRDESQLKNMRGDIRMVRVKNVLIERLFDSGCLLSARAVYETLAEHELDLPEEIVSDLGSLCRDKLHCEDDPDYIVRCPTCNAACSLMSPRDVCGSCERPFERELCLFDPISTRREPTVKELGRKIVFERDIAVIICTYCKSSFLFRKYLDDSKCMLCECPW